MRKFSITNPDYTGEIFITYNHEGLLVAFDAVDTTVKDIHIRWLMANTPQRITIDYANELKAFLSRTKCELIEVPLDISFETFWNLYDHKIHKPRAEAAFNKLPQTDKLLCILSIKKYDKYLGRFTWKGKQQADTYIKSQNYKADFDKLKN